MKRFIPLIVFFLFCSLASSEEMFTTFASSATLSKSDVSLKLDDKELPIADFFHVNVAERTPEILLHPAGRRQYIILVDFLYLSPAQVLEARKMAQDFIAQVPRDDLIAIAAITNEDGLRFFSGLTTDRSKLVAAWNAMGQVVFAGMMEGPDGNLYSKNYSSDHVPVELLPDESFLANIKTYSVPEKAKKDLAPLYVQAFVDLASLFSTLDGRKNLILFSPGTDVKGLSVDLQEKKKEESKQSNEPEEEHKTIGELTTVGPRDLEAIAKEESGVKRRRESDASVVSRLMEGSDAHVHVVHPSGEETVFLKDLADKTRGSYTSAQQFGGAISRILNADSSFYVLGWQGSSEKEFHELHVMEIKAAGTKIEDVTRWLAPKTIVEFSPLEKKMRISQAIYKDFGSSDQNKYWSDFFLDEGLTRVSVFTEVPGSSLLTHNAKQVSVEFYGFSIAQDGRVEDFYHLPIVLDLSNPKLKDRLQKAGLKVWNVLFGGHGPMSIRTIIMNLQNGETITQSSSIHFRDTEFLISIPFFPSSNFDWIFWPKPDQPLNRRGMEILYPYKIGPDIFAPELSPTLHPAEKGRVVYFKMYNFLPGDRYPTVHLRFLAENGSPIEIEKFGLLQRPRQIQRGGLEVFWQIETMPDLSKGNYRLQVDVTDQKQGKEVIRDVEATVQ